MAQQWASCSKHQLTQEMRQTLLSKMDFCLAVRTLTCGENKQPKTTLLMVSPRVINVDLKCDFHRLAQTRSLSDMIHGTVVINFNNWVIYEKIDGLL